MRPEGWQRLQRINKTTGDWQLVAKRNPLLPMFRGRLLFSFPFLYNLWPFPEVNVVQDCCSLNKVDNSYWVSDWIRILFNESGWV